MHGDTDDVLTIDTGGRSFQSERDTPTSSGWLLREFYRDGWPVMAGPFPTAESATAYIDTLVDAGNGRHLRTPVPGGHPPRTRGRRRPARPRPEARPRDGHRV